MRQGKRRGDAKDGRRILRVYCDQKYTRTQHEKTPEIGHFRGSFEEFSYENVNLYKGKFIERPYGRRPLFHIPGLLTFW